MTVWNPDTIISEKTSDGWYWDGLQRYEDRATAVRGKNYYLSREAPLMEAKVVKRGGSADPHFRILYRLVE